MMISHAASSELARSARAQVCRSSRFQSLSLQTPAGTGVIPYSTDSGINRYRRFAPVLRSMARREQWRGHFHAVIKYVLEPARDDKADASGGQGSPGRRNLTRSRTSARSGLRKAGKAA